MNELYQGKDPRHIGTYTAAEASRYLRVPLSTVRSWVFGSRSGAKNHTKPFSSVLQLPEPEVRLLSFINLVELHVLNAVRRHHKISLEKVRQSIAYIQNAFGNEHPLACQQLYTDGKDLFVEHFGQWVNTSKSGQLAIPEIIQVYLQRIEWDEFGVPQRLYPWTRLRETESPKWIAIDPRLSFGQPVVVGTGIPTAMLAQRYAAGESIDELAADYGCERLQVEEAIRYELPLAA